MKLKLLQVRESTGIKAISPSDVYEAMGPEALADRECFWVLHLNSQMEIVEKELVSMGGLDTASAHPREVYKKAILNSASCLILVHNHPSGDLTPSYEDKKINKRLTEAGELLGIPVTDHIIISTKGYYSFAADKTYRNEDV